MLFCLRNVPYLLMWPPLDRGTESTASGKEIHWFITSALERIIELKIRCYWIHRNTNTVARFTHIHISHYHWGSHLDSGCEAHIYIPSVRLTHVYIPSVGLTHIYIPGVRLTHTWITTVRLTHIYINIVRLTHLYINIISEAHSYLRTMSVRLSHTWVITARLTHSYMYAGYRLGVGGLTRIYILQVWGSLTLELSLSCGRLTCEYTRLKKH